jgi:hypothetical protein
MRNAKASAKPTLPHHGSCRVPAKAREERRITFYPAPSVRAYVSTLLLVGILFLLSIPAQASDLSQEHLGEFSFSNYVLEPSLNYAERRDGSFHAGNSYIELNWNQETSGLSAVFRVGSASLIGKPVRYGLNAANSGDNHGGEQVQIVEAYAQAETGFGEFRLGIVPLPFGLEGGDAETRMRFPRSLLFSRGFIGLRDQGASFHIADQGFFSDWAVHNGEGGTDLDNQIWFTARGGYQTGQLLLVGFSATVGRTTPLSTNPNGTSDSNSAVLDVTRAARIRVGDFFLRVGNRNVGFELEGASGDVRQGDGMSKFQSVRTDVDWQFYKGLAVLARWDRLTPKANESGNLVRETSAGFAWRNQYETSIITCLLTKTVDQAAPTSLGVRLSWRLTPTVMGRLAPL